MRKWRVLGAAMILTSLVVGTSATTSASAATPSLESWENARTGKYRLLSLPARVVHVPSGRQPGAVSGALSPAGER